MKNSGGTESVEKLAERKTVPLAKVQSCEYENQTLEAFVAPVATAHACETGLVLLARQLHV